MKVLILGNSSLSSRIIIEQLDKIQNLSIDYLVYPAFTFDKRDRNSIRRWRDKSWVFLFTKIFSFYIDPLFSIILRKKIKNSLKNSGINHLRIFNRVDERISEIVSHNYSLIISIGHRLLNDSILKSANTPILNLHGGHLPKYGGIANEFWVRFYGEKCMFITIHCMEEKLDSGPIIFQASVKINDSWSVLMTNFFLNVFAGAQLNLFLQEFSRTKHFRYRQTSYKPVIRSFPDKNQVRVLKNRGVKVIKFSDFCTLYDLY